MVNIIKVLLTTTIDSLGSVGEVVNVADGYARNFLLPKRYAVAPNEHNIARFAKERDAHMAEIEEREERALRLRDKLADRILVFTRKAHDNEKLYGSVRSEDIISQIEEDLGEQIESSRVQIEEAIDTLGEHAVTINLYKDINVELRIRVDEEGAAKEE
ncbi:MAG TPA: 50S ribosomal protein L9 [Candidatus Acetothermia bacterium]|nr:50S ribosomal protein L9 [Candidatus Acetothermia bacterium]